MNFQDDISSIPFYEKKQHYVLVFELTSMQNATEIFHQIKLVGDPPRLYLNFTFPLAYVNELIVLGGQMSSISSDKFAVVKNLSETIDVQHLVIRNLLLN